MIDYLELVPPIIRDAVKALNGDNEWRVFISLLENKEMTVEQLSKATGLGYAYSRIILIHLGKGGLVAQYTSDLSDIDSTTYYKVTSIGRDFVEALMDKFLPEVKE